MKILDYIALVRQRWVAAVAVVATVASAALLISLIQDPVYVARVKMRVRPPAPGSAAGDILQSKNVQDISDLYTEGEILRSTDVSKRVAPRLGLVLTTDEQFNNLLDRISVQPVRASAIIFVEARASNEALARNLANAFAEEYLNERREDARAQLAAFQQENTRNVQAITQRIQQINQRLTAVGASSAEAGQLQADLSNLQAELAVIQTAVRTVASDAAINRGYGDILTFATTATSERSQSPARSLVFGILVGSALAVAVVLVLDTMSDTVRTKDDVELQTEVEVLGIVPYDERWTDPSDDRVASEREPFGAIAEQYRTLRHNLGRTLEKVGARTVLITSPVEGEGKSVTAANLALAYADTGRRVVLVEADLRRPRAYRFLGARPEPGLTDALEGGTPLLSTVQRLRPRLTFVAAGARSERPDLVVNQADLRGLLNGLLDLADRPRGRDRTTPLRAAGGEDDNPPVIIDAGPILQAAEVSSLAAAVDGVILVVRSGVTSRAAAAEAAEQVRRAGGRLLGAVLVGVQSASEMPGRRAYLPRFITDIRDQISGLRAG